MAADREVPPLDELKEVCWKPQDEWISANFYRHVSIRLTWLLAHTRVTANGATTLGVLAAILAWPMLASGRAGWILAGAVLSQLWVVMDHVDGEIARLRAHWGCPGPPITGEFWDYVGNHLVAHTLLFAFTGYGLFQLWGDATYLYLGFVATFASILSMGVWLAKRQLQFAYLHENPDAGTSADDEPGSGEDSDLGEERTGIVDVAGRFFEEVGDFKPTSLILLAAAAVDLALVATGTGPLAPRFHLHAALPAVLWVYGGIYPLATVASIYLHLDGRVEEGVEDLAE